MRATDSQEALEKAKELYYLIERHSFDNERNGYLEAFTADWKQIEDMRLSEKDANERKDNEYPSSHFGTVFQLISGLAFLELKSSIRNLLEIFLDTILDQNTGHLHLFFDENWNSKSKIISYGQHIERFLPMYEAALVVGEDDLIERVKKIIPLVAEATKEGLADNGGLIYEKNESTGHKDGDFHWWVQAEAVVGFSYAAKITGNEEYASIAQKCWFFISSHLIDRDKGEWFWSIKSDGVINRIDDKAGFWKCPYHNGRMCMEIMELDT